MMLQVLTVWVLVMKWLRIGCVGFFSSPPLISLVLCWRIEECSLSSLMLTPCKANGWVQGVVDPEVTGKWAPVLGKIAAWIYMKPKKVFCSAGGTAWDFLWACLLNAGTPSLCRWDDFCFFLWEVEMGLACSLSNCYWSPSCRLKQMKSYKAEDVARKGNWGANLTRQLMS